MALASPVNAAALSSNYLDETALVFKPAAIAQLPASIFLPSSSLTFSHDVRLACKAVHPRGDDLLVFLADTRICLTLTELFALASETRPEQALFAITDQDRRKLIKSLETESLVVMQPTLVPQSSALVDGVAAALVCYCPNAPTIFADGFEAAI